MSLKYLTRRTAISAATKSPSVTNFNHIRSFPRAWLVRHSKHDPRLKSVRPQDRIKYWNIVPGDQIRLRGDAEDNVHEVLSVNRISNRVFVKGPAQAAKDGQPPPSKNYHYSRCQLFIGERLAPLKGNADDIEVQKIFASRLGTSGAVWDYFYNRWSWKRYAVATTPKLPGWTRGTRLRIPWPANVKNTYPEPTSYDTPADEVARITYQLPDFEPIRGGAVPAPPSETEYFDHIYNPQLKTPYNPTAPYEVFLATELANPHSRAKKMERYKAYQARLRFAYDQILADEERYPNGRSLREIKADAAFKFRELVKAEEQKKVKARWSHSAEAESRERKEKKATKKEERLRKRLNELVLDNEPNQVIPKSLQK